MKRLFFITIGLSVFILSSNAQVKYDAAEFKLKPVWIEMMNDSTVNYHLAVKAFNDYWEGREKPEDDADKKDEKQSRKEEREHKRYEKKLAKMTPAERNEFDNLNYQFKRFKIWMFDVKPFVQPDGRILTRNQRLDIHFRQQEQKKQQSKGN